MDHLKELDRQVRELEAQIQAWHRSDETSRRLARVPGIGPLTASALVASVGNAKSFRSGRQLAAWLGLVPRQNSSGGKNVLLSISKRGDVYLRTYILGSYAISERRTASIVDHLKADVECRFMAGSCLLGIRRTPPVRVSPVSQKHTLRYEPIISAEWQPRVDSNPHL
ncbi:transposase [Caballeronia terrestris]|uniref:Transposase n=1 Tax=Caballeronia terrestris TaxID=1226301 RepID=A0A158KGP3_9BURK|nr:transposase [Caballeronia terrestris]